MKSPDCCITAVQAHCKKSRLFRLDVDKEYHYGNVFSGWMDLLYNKILLFLLLNPVEYYYLSNHCSVSPIILE